MLRRRNLPGAGPGFPPVLPRPRYSGAGTGRFSPPHRIAAGAAHL